MRFFNRLFLLFCLMPLWIFADTTKDSLIPQTIIYQTDKAAEVYLVWAMNNWKIPENQYLATGSYIKNGMAYTPMRAVSNGFQADLLLPRNIYIDFMIWASKDKQGRASESWDNNWGSNYNLYIDGRLPSKLIRDDKLVIVQAKAIPFNILKKGKLILLFGALLFVSGWLLRRLTGRNTGSFQTPANFIAGSMLASLIIMWFIRLQLNKVPGKQVEIFFGALWHDLLYMIYLGTFVALTLYATRKHYVAHLLVSVLSGVLIGVSLLAALLNIEVLHQLGKPLTYNWLYYSDFLQSNDAKSVLVKNLTPGLLSNLSLIFIGVLGAAVGFSLMIGIVENKKRLALAGLAVIIILLTGGKLQLKENHLSAARIANPLSVFVGSWLQREDGAPLFSMNIPADAMDSVISMHANRRYASAGTDSQIRNIVVFVMESTPAGLVQVYDSSYRATPNLYSWRKHARIYTNMYAHVPNTVSSIYSILSGLYPMVSYKSVVKEYPGLSTPSLTASLGEQSWSTSFFFSSDLSYSNIDSFLSRQQVRTVEDFKTIPCSHPALDADYANLGGLDDRCIPERYLQWRDSITSPKTFSVLWTNQTHYPYFASGREHHYSPDKSLNTYLNALEADDAAFGLLMKGLEKRKLLDQTLVIVIGDHGEAFGSHDQYTHASNIFEENMHVPCLLINPGRFHGERDDRIAGMIDIAPTVLNTAGIPSPQLWQGNSLLQHPGRSHTFFIGPFSDFQFGSRFGHWKLIHNGATGRSALYDLSQDRGELHDLSPQHPEMMKHQLQLMAAWVQYHTRFMNDLLALQK